MTRTRQHYRRQLQHPGVDGIEHQLRLDGLFHQRQLLRLDGLDAAQIVEQLGAPSGQRLAGAGAAVNRAGTEFFDRAFQGRYPVRLRPTRTMPMALPRVSKGVQVCPKSVHLRQSRRKASAENPLISLESGRVRSCQVVLSTIHYLAARLPCLIEVSSYCARNAPAAAGRRLRWL
jgi:hypothetical protein